jgi:hypothetical protein
VHYIVTIGRCWVAIISSKLTLLILKIAHHVPQLPPLLQFGREQSKEEELGAEDCSPIAKVIWFFFIGWMRIDEDCHRRRPHHLFLESAGRNHH